MSYRIGDLPASSTIAWNDLFEKETDSFGASNRTTMKDLRTGLFVGGSGFNTTTDPLNCGAIGCGAVTSTSNLYAGAANYHGFTGRAVISSPADSILLLQNNATNDFARLQLGGTTSSFPAIKRSSAAIHIRLADDSNYTALLAGDITSSGAVIAAAGSSFSMNGRSAIFSPSDGVLWISNNAGTDFSRLQFGGQSSSFPAIKRSSTSLQIRLADDSAYADLTLGLLTASSAVGVSLTAGDIKIVSNAGFGMLSANDTRVLVVTNSGVTIPDLFGTTLTLGTNPATSGAIRMANTDQIVARNGGNSANVPMMYMDGSDVIRLGAQTWLGSSAGAVRFSYDTAANFPAAAAGLNGVLGVDSTNNRLVVYSGGNRYYVTPDGTF